MLDVIAPKRLGLLLACSVLAAACVSARAQENADARWTHVQNGEVFSADTASTDRTLSYTVHWDSLDLDEAVNGAATTISATSYFCACGNDEARPVMFVFNGGPGASSSPLHFALGPNLRGEGETGISANPDTILEWSDLVFIDPVETGYSRSASGDGESKHLGVAGDVEAVSAFIHAWLEQHERPSAPVFVTGQSYGGFRLSNLAPELADLDVAGLIMVSPAIDMTSGTSDASYVFTFPTMAATAWRFGKSSIDAESEDAAWEIARNFAETDYLLALQPGDQLVPDRRAEMATTIAGMTGLPAELVETSNLRVGIQDFLETVLADENMLVSRLNTAVTQEKRPPANPDRPDGANDPSLGLGRTNMIISADIGAYLQTMTGLKREDGYRSLNLDANFAWDWRDDLEASPFGLNAAPRLAAYLNENEDVSLLVFGGYRDLAVPVLETEYVLTHSGLPAGRVELVKMLGGHSPYAEEALGPVFSQHITDFIQSALDTRAANQEAAR